MVFLSQGDPQLIGAGIRAAGVLARRGRGILRRVGGLIKRGASKLKQIIKSPTAREVITVGGGAAVGAVAGAVVGGREVGGFTVIRVSRPRAASPGGRPLQLLTAQGRIINLQRRRRGLSATELRGFRKVVSLLSRVGMTPKRLGGRRIRRKGNPE